MKLKLLRRRLTISAPRMAVRSAMPWPLRWLLLSVVLGFSAATMLWAYEFGRDIAGLDRNIEQELVQVRGDLEALRSELAKAQQVANTAESLLTAEKAAQNQLLLQIRQLESDNQVLRNDLGFFERLIPGTGNAAPTIRGLQVERVSDSELKWQALVMQATKNAPEFKGVLDVTFSGTLEGRPWSVVHPTGAQAVLIKSYLRQEGVVNIPSAAVVKTVTARVLQGSTVIATHTIKL
jgi:cell shape-determining protein MreC